MTALKLARVVICAQGVCFVAQLVMHSLPSEWGPLLPITYAVNGAWLVRGIDPVCEAPCHSVRKQQFQLGLTALVFSRPPLCRRRAHGEATGHASGQQGNTIVESKLKRASSRKRG